MFEISKTPDGEWALVRKNDQGVLTYLFILTTDEVLEVFNKVVPLTVEKPYMKGNLECTHKWSPWKFNPKFNRCSKCPAMMEIKKLVPMEYK